MQIYKLKGTINDVRTPPGCQFAYASSWGEM